jgi:hypothetical protein
MMSESWNRQIIIWNWTIPPELMSSGKQQYELVTAMQPDSQENAIREITSRITNLEAKINTHQPDDTMVRLSCQQVAAAQLQLAVAGHSWGVCGTAWCAAQVGGSHNEPIHVTAEPRFHAIQPVSFAIQHNLTSCSKWAWKLPTWVDCSSLL